MNKALILLLAAATIVSCSKNEGPGTPQPAPEGAQVISLGTTIEKEIDTKSAAISTTALTGIHFLKLDAATAPSGMASASPFKGNRAGDATGAVTWTASDGGTAQTADKPVYNKNNQNAYLVGCWPSAGATVTGSNIDWTIDGKTDILVSYIFSAGNYVTPLDGTGATKFIFNHKLAQLQIVLKADAAPVSIDAVRAAWGNINKIELVGTLPTASYTYSTNAVTFTGTAADKELYKEDTFNDALAAFAVPENSNTDVNASGMFAAATSGTAPIKIRISSTVGAAQEVIVQLKQNTTDTDKGFEAGLTHKVTLTLGAANKEIKVLSTTITAWTNGYSGSGSLEK